MRRLRSVCAILAVLCTGLLGQDEPSDDGLWGLWGAAKKVLLYQAAGALRLDVTTNGSGALIVRETPAGARQYDTQEPMTEPWGPSPWGPPPDAPPPFSSAGIAVSLGSTFFAVTEPGKVLQLDMQTQTQVRSLATSQKLRGGTASPGNQFLYLLSTGLQTSTSLTPSVQIVDMATFQIPASIPLAAGVIPRGLVATPDGRYLYVAGELAATVSTDPSAAVCQIVDLRTRSVTKRLDFEGSSARPEILISLDGARVFMTAPAGVAVIDTQTQTLSHTIRETAGHIAIDPSGTSLFIAPVLGPFVDNPSPPPQLTRLPGVAVYDLSTSTLVRHIPVPELSSTMAMAVTADGATLMLDMIGRDPVTGRNDWPRLHFISLPSGRLVLTKPWTYSRETPVTVHRLIPVPGPPE